MNDWTARPKQLIDAALFVESIPDAQFNMGYWWLPDGMAFDDDRNVMYRVADGPCGCAAGNMAQSGKFEFGATIFDNNRQRVFVILGDHFGLPFGLAQFIFDHYSYPRLESIRQSDVARRMRYVAAEYGFS